MLIPPAEIRIVIVEDDEALRSALASFLKLSGFDVAEEGTALGLYDRLARESFDVAVIDLGLPDLDGTRVTEFLRAHTDAGVIVLTARLDIDSRVNSYQSGADVFMAKPVDTRELTAAIHSLAERRRKAQLQTAQDPSQSSTWDLNRSARLLIAPEGTTVELTGTEFDLIELLAGGCQSVVKHEVLAQSLYGRLDESSKKALDAAIGRLRRKIAQGGVSVPIKTNYSLGYSFAAPIRIR